MGVTEDDVYRADVWRGLPPAAHPTPIGVDPLPPHRWWRGHREIHTGDQLPLPPAAADRDDLVRVVEIHAVDSRGRPENLRRERDGELLLQHREESHTLFGLAVGIDDGFVDQRVKVPQTDAPAAPQTRSFRMSLCHTTGDRSEAAGRRDRRLTTRSPFSFSSSLPSASSGLQRLPRGPRPITCHDDAGAVGRWSRRVSPQPPSVRDDGDAVGERPYRLTPYQETHA